MPAAKFHLRRFPEPSEYRCKFCDRKIMKNFFEQNVTTLPDMFWHRALRLAAVAASLFLNVFPLCLFRVICSLLHYGDTAMIRAPHAVNKCPERYGTPRRG